jgi:hypothetical protein
LRLPIDTSQLTSLVVACGGTSRAGRGRGARHTDVNGKALKQVQVLAPGDRGEIDRVATPVDRKVAQVEAVGVESLAANGP